MSRPKPLYLILCWHMHQPDYRDYASQDFTLPWTYLHAIKDYTDMAWHMEHHPEVRAVFNFVPILLDQLEDYAEQFARGELRDPLLRLLRKGSGQAFMAEERKLLVESCFRNNQATMLKPFAAYQKLHELWLITQTAPEGRMYLSDQYYADLVTWYHLAWTGESLRRDKPLIARLIGKASNFSAEDRFALLDLIGEAIRDVIPRYRRLADAGRIELSTTPYYHPIAPLLINFASARESWPEVSLPAVTGYPGGQERALLHVESAMTEHAKRFGKPPHGIWPAEGGISIDAALMFARAGAQWTASGEGVLRNSLVAKHRGDGLPPRHEYLYRPYRLARSGASISCFFRDDALSDRIGFEYWKWLGSDAANDFVQSLETIRSTTPPDQSPVVSVILDGENAWEFYPYNGHYFFYELYEKLSSHPFIRTTTFAQYLQTEGKYHPAHSCSGLLAGSWVYGNFSTWIGSPEKNRAWELLAHAKTCYDQVMREAKLDATRAAMAARQLANCEGSDWFWWLGDYNPSESVASFDSLFRQNLRNLYRLLEVRVPDEINESLGVGSGNPEVGGAMRRAN